VRLYSLRIAFANRSLRLECNRHHEVVVQNFRRVFLHPGPKCLELVVRRGLFLALGFFVKTKHARIMAQPQADGDPAVGCACIPSESEENVTPRPM
jgi:hypothetical protein